MLRPFTCDPWGHPPGMPAGLQIPRSRPWISTGGSRIHFLTSKKAFNLPLDFWWYFDSQIIRKASKNRSKIDQKDFWFFPWFFKPFWLHFGNFFSLFVLPKISQNRKMRFYENKLLVHTRCSFSRISAPTIYPKIDEKNDRKIKNFLGPLLEGLGSHSVTFWDQNRI